MRKAFLLLLPGLVLATPSRADETATAILARAIKAHGGEEKLAGALAYRVKAQGIRLLDDKPMPFTSETTVQFPGQFKNVMTFAMPGAEWRGVQVLNGNRGWVSVNGQTQPADAGKLAALKELQYLDHVERLVPLLREKDTFTLTALGESKVEGRPALGVKVESKGRPEVRLYFDRESGLLVKNEHRTVEGSKEVRQEVYYSDYKEDPRGCKRPMRAVVYRDGKKSMEGKLTEVKYFDKVPESEFDKP